MKKKIVALFLVAVMACSFCGCGESGQNGDVDSREAAEAELDSARILDRRNRRRGQRDYVCRRDQ